MKKLLLTTAALLSIAGSALAQTSKFEGVSATLGLGYQSVKPKYDNFLNRGTTPASIGSTNSTGVVGNLGLEYTSTMGSSSVISYGLDYMVGSGKESDLTYNGSAITDKSKYTQKHRFFIAPGTLIDNDKIGYFKLGYGQAEIKTISTGSSDTVTSNFFSYGVGMKVMKEAGFFYFGEFNMISGKGKAFVATDRSTWDSKGNGYNFIFGIGKQF